MRCLRLICSRHSPNDHTRVIGYRVLMDISMTLVLLLVLMNGNSCPHPYPHVLCLVPLFILLIALPFWPKVLVTSLIHRRFCLMMELRLEGLFALLRRCSHRPLPLLVLMFLLLPRLLIASMSVSSFLLLTTSPLPHLIVPICLAPCTPCCLPSSFSSIVATLTLTCPLLDHYVHTSLLLLLCAEFCHSSRYSL